MKATDEKIQGVRAVQHAVEQAMEKVIHYLSTTPLSNAEKAHAIIDEVLDHYNCESPEGHIVAGGIHAVEPHEKGSGDLELGVPIVIDIYPRSKETGYFADMTRTVCIGNATEEMKKMYQTVVSAQKIAVQMIKPGTACFDIQQAVETYFIDQGYTTYGTGTEFTFAQGFVHGVGHGVSKILHDAPRIGRGTVDVLLEGDIISIEPGLYYSDIGAVRIEDLFLVTKDGYEKITNFNNQFEI